MGRRIVGAQSNQMLKQRYRILLSLLEINLCSSGQRGNIVGSQFRGRKKRRQRLLFVALPGKRNAL